MEDVLPRLNKAKVFTVCDVKNGFWHVQLEEQSSGLPHLQLHMVDINGTGYLLGLHQHLNCSIKNWISAYWTYPVLQESWTIFLSGEKERL